MDYRFNEIGAGLFTSVGEIKEMLSYIAADKNIDIQVNYKSISVSAA